MSEDSIPFRNVSSISGLVLRRFRGESDYEDMASVVEGALSRDGVERTQSAARLAATYARLSNCDLSRDFVAAELEGRMIGYARCAWSIEDSGGDFIGTLVAHIAPEWRGRGLGRVLLAWLEGRMGEIARELAGARTCYFQAGCAEGELAKARLLERAGYRVLRHFVTMERPSLELIPDFRLPEGFVTRPVRPEDWPAIWKAQSEAFKDHWGASDAGVEDYEAWLADPRGFTHGLWQIAWDEASGRVAGGVLAFIDREENEKSGKARGHTDGVFVARDWRRRGIARALVAASLRAQGEAGMETSVLGVDSESPTGAVQVYLDCGFVPVKTSRVFRKSFDPGRVAGS